MFCAAVRRGPRSTMSCGDTERQRTVTQRPGGLGACRCISDPAHDAVAQPAFGQGSWHHRTVDPADLLDGRPVAASVYERVYSCLDALGSFEVRTTKSQIAFRRTRGFAYLWLPDQYLKNADAEVVLSIALGRRDGSKRFKEVAHPAERHWMHHLELDGPDEIDEEVVAWLREAAERAG